MILGADIGNTNVKLGWFENNILIKTETMSLDAWQQQMKKSHEFADVSTMIVSDVRGMDESWLVNLPFEVFNIDWKTAMPISNKYDTPETLGIDRLLGAVAANAMNPNEDVLVIDAGTCITYDVVSNSNYLGGAISPGLQMRLTAMNQFTGKLPNLKFSPEVVTIGTTTESSMQMGTGTACAREMDGMIDQFSAQFPNLKVILTGGDATFFEGHLKNATFAAPNLILNGLYTVYQHNVNH